LLKVRSLTTGIAALAAAIALCAAPAAQADDVFWINKGTDVISRASIPEGGGGDLPIPSQYLDNPRGLALAPAANRIFWLNSGGGGSIGYARLDGGDAALLPTPGASFVNPSGLAIDTDAGRLYWGNPGAGSIGFAALDGGSTGTLSPGAATAEPNALAIDPGGGRVFWTNFAADRISYARLDGSGGGDIDTAGAPVDGPEGIAISPEDGRLYWSNWKGGSIGYANTSGGGGGQFMPTIGMANPLGIAFGIHAGGMFWANEGFDSIEYSNGAAGGNVQPDGATIDKPAWPTVLAYPGPLTLPVISGATRPGSVLTCTNGEWFPDRPQSYLFQAPEPERFSYEWERNERAIPGATGSTLRADKVGKYKCRVFAFNAAGRGDAPSRFLRVSASLSLGRVRLHPGHGTASLTAKVTGSGPLVLSGKGLERVRLKRARRTVHLQVRPAGRGLSRLMRVGRLAVRAKVAYTPAGGKPLRRSRKIVLRLRRPPG
jgi:hypothetical protein